MAEYITGLVPGSRIEFAPPLPQDPSNRRPDLSLARSLLPGWSAEVPYEAGVKRTLEWFKTELAGSAMAPSPRPVRVCA